MTAALRTGWSQTDRGSISRPPSETASHFTRRLPRAVIRSPSRPTFLTPLSPTSHPTAPNFSSEAVLLRTRETVLFGSYRCWDAHPANWVALLPETQPGLKTERRLPTLKEAACTGSGLTGPNRERSSALPRVELLSGPVGHLTEAVCVSACRRKTTAPHSGKSPPTEEISTRCFPDGTIRPRTVAVVGRPTASTSSSNHSGAGPRTSGPCGKREASSGRSTTDRYS